MNMRISGGKKGKLFRKFCEYAKWMIPVQMFDGAKSFFEIFIKL